MPSPDGPAGRPARRVPPAVWTALFALAATLILTHGLWTAPGSTRIAGNGHDIDLYTWDLQHAAFCVAHRQNPFYFTTLNAPTGVNAMWNTSVIVPGLLLAPVTLLASPLASYNVMVLVGVTGTAAGGHLLARRFVDHDLAAAAGALLWAFSPALGATELGHLSLAFTPLVPLILLAFDDVVRGTGPASSAGVRLGLLCALQLLTGEELLFETGLFLAVVLLALTVRCRTQLRGLVPRLRPALGLAVLEFGIIAAYPLYVQFFGRLTEHGTPFPPDDYVSDLRGLVTPSARQLGASAGQSAFAASYHGGAPEYVAYVGAPLLVIALATVVLLRRRPLVIALGGAALTLTVGSLGGHLVLDGSHTGIPLPWALVDELPVLEAALPNRLMLLAALAIAGLAALGADRALAARRRTARAAAAAAALAVVLSVLPAPYAVEATSPVPDFFSHVSTLLPRGSTALVLPYADNNNTEPMRWQARSDMAFAMPGGYFIGPDEHGTAHLDGVDDRLATGRLLSHVVQTGDVPDIGPAERHQLADDLRTWGAAAIIVGPSDHQDQVVQAVSSLMQREPVVTGGIALWRI